MLCRTMGWQRYSCVTAHRILPGHMKRPDKNHMVPSGKTYVQEPSAPANSQLSCCSSIWDDFREHACFRSAPTIPPWPDYKCKICHLSPASLVGRHLCLGDSQGGAHLIPLGPSCRLFLFGLFGSFQVLVEMLGLSAKHGLKDTLSKRFRSASSSCFIWATEAP